MGEANTLNCQQCSISSIKKQQQEYNFLVWVFSLTHPIIISVCSLIISVLETECMAWSGAMGHGTLLSPEAPEASGQEVVLHWQSRMSEYVPFLRSLFILVSGHFPMQALQWKVDSYLFIAKFNPLRQTYVKSQKCFGWRRRFLLQ